MGYDFNRRVCSVCRGNNGATRVSKGLGMLNWILDLEARHQSKLARHQLRQEYEDSLREREVRALEAIAAKRSEQTTHAKDPR